MDKLNGIMNELTDMANFKGFGESKEIINGVNVAGCKYFQIEANELYPKAHYCGSTFNRFCEDDDNCVYKQLKRLEFELKVTKADYEASEQENAELKAENELLREENLVEQTQYTEVVSENVQKIRQLKQTLQEVKAIAEDNIIGCFSDKCDLADEILQKITKAEEE